MRLPIPPYPHTHKDLSNFMEPTAIPRMIIYFQKRGNYEQAMVNCHGFYACALVLSALVLNGFFKKQVFCFCTIIIPYFLIYVNTLFALTSNLFQRIICLFNRYISFTVELLKQYLIWVCFSRHKHLQNLYRKSTTKD